MPRYTCLNTSICKSLTLEVLRLLTALPLVSQVRIAAVLSMGKMAASAPRSVATSAAAFLAEKLNEQSASSALRAPLTYALGSTATPLGVQTLLKIAKSSTMTPYQVQSDLEGLKGSELPVAPGKAAHAGRL